MAVQDPIGANIDAVVAMHAVAEQQVDTHQRTVESLTAWLGRPQFFYGILVGAGLWMGVNAAAPLYPQFHAIVDRGVALIAPQLSARLRDAAIKIDADLPQSH